MAMAASETLAQCLARVASIVGEEHASAAGEAICVAPANKEQIAEVLRLADVGGLCVAPVGSGSKWGWGNPVRPAIRLGLGRMQALREHAWADMTCTVEAGCSWAAMQNELQRHGQMVALDALWPERATVGGVVATNDSGALRLRYGGLRDLIIGMTLVLADGTIARTGGKVVKNVAGYDLQKLMTGSFGTLGVIAEVNFRLHPVEKDRLSCTVAAPEPAAFAAPLQKLLRWDLSLSSVQVRTGKEQCALDIALAGRPECLAEHQQRVKDLLGEAAVTEADEAVWQARQRLFESTLVLKVSVLPAEVCAVSSDLQQWSAANGMEVASVAQATGLMTVALQSAVDRGAELVEFLRRRVAACGGSAVVLRLPDALRSPTDIWGADPDSLPLMREIKRRFDPHRILNPGRFVGDI